MIDYAQLFEANATRHAAPRQAAPRQLQLPHGHDQRRGHRGADAGPEGEGGQDLQVHAPRGPLAARERRRCVKKGPFEGDYLKATTDPRLAAPRAQARRCRARRSTLEGFLFPATYEMIAGASAKRPRRAPARRVRAELRQGRLKAARKAQPDALRRADHRLDGRARGAARRGAPADRRGHLQPPQAGHAARHRRHHPLPDQQLDAAAAGLRAASATRRTTRARAAACRRRRSATPASPRSRRPPTRRRPSTCSSCASPASPASTPSRRPNAQFERDVARYQASRGGP